MPMGFGGYLYSDVTGPTSRTGLTGAYSYYVEITRDIRLSMGLSLGIMQYKIDGNQLTIKDPDDQAILTTVYSSYVPDASFGVYASADEWYAGISTSQLFNNKLKIFEEKSGLNKLKSHVYLHGGYKYKINRDYVLEPTAIIKITAPKAFQFDLSTRVTYDEMVWGGLSYRLKDALAIMIGYIHNEQFYFGYSYDIGVSDLRKYNSGSHELMIGYRFNDVR
jgi:type IX secretion system PorP/SprF family membrane protein